MPEPKKAPAQLSIASFFRPRKEPSISERVMDDLVDLTVGESSSLEPIQLEDEIEHQAIPAITVVSVASAPTKPADDISRPVKRHSFFSRFDDKVQRQKEAESSNDARLTFVRQTRQVMKEKAPVFPLFLGNTGSVGGYKSEWTYEMRKDVEFDMAQWSQLPIPRCVDETRCSFTYPPKLYRTSGVDQVYQVILDNIRGKKETKPGRRWIFHDEEDDDDWLPTGFRDLSAFSKPKSDIESHVHLVVGPTGTGKSYLASRLANELQAFLITLNVVGNGPKGERTGKPFEDLLTSAEHHDLLIGSSDMQVVLIDEIDLVFEGDRGFVSGLATYLANVPSRHVVIMTSNAPVNVLSKFYSFTRDVCVHELELKGDCEGTVERPVDFVSIERTSQQDLIKTALTYEGESSLITCIDDWRGPSTSHSKFQRSSRHISASYCRYITAQKYRAPPPSLSTWHTDVLPTWFRLEVIHAAAEEERALMKRRRQTTMRFAAGSRITNYLRLPQDITSHVLSLYSLE